MVTRTRLIDRITHQPVGNWIIEAGAGYGKSVLVNELRSARETPLILVRRTRAPHSLAALLNELIDAARRTGIPDLAEQLGAAEDSPHRIADALVQAQCSLALDDVHVWQDDVAEFVVALAEEIDISPEIMLVLVGRSLPAPLRRVRTDPNWNVLNTQDLALHVDEVAQIVQTSDIADDVGAAEFARSLHALSGGWPAAVVTVCARLRAHPESASAELARYDALIDGLMHGYLDDVDPDDLAAGRTLAMLPFFDERIAELAGSPGLIARLASAGIPMTRQADGWTELPEQFRASLFRSSPSQAFVALDPRISAHFVQRGEIHAAINACLAVGDNEGAAQIVASASYAHESQLDPVALNAAMTTIGDVADRVPRSLLVQAQVNVSHGSFAEGLSCIERAERAAGVSDPDLTDPVHQEILLELGVWRHFTSDDHQATTLMERCKSAIKAEPELVTDANRARLLDLQGLLSTMDCSRDSLEAARVHLAEALAIWRRLQEPRAAAATALRLVAHVLHGLGRRQEAIALLDSLPAVGPMTLVNRARVQLERVRLLPYLGRGSEVAEAAGEARRIAELIGHDWLLGVAPAYEAVAASLVGDDEQVDALYQELALHPDRFVTGADAGYAWCTMADALIRCGKFDQAETALASARQSEGLEESLYEFGVAALAAHSADPAHAVALLDELAIRDDVMPERRWAIALLYGVCALRAGNQELAQKHVQSSFDEAAALDHETLPLIAERKVVEQIRRADEPSDAGASPSQMVDATGVVEISIFDGFELAINGDAIGLPGGQITDLVKLLVLSDGRLLVDQVIDRLWPEADLAVGRPRLRNVLKRLRKACDELVERSGEALILAEHVNSDYGRAVGAGRNALAASASLAEVTHAVSLNTRSLLPDDRYADWAEDARRDHQSRLVKLLDRQADLAEREGDVDLAVAALEAAHEADGTTSQRIVHGSALLRAVGRTAAADALADRQGVSLPA